MEWTPRWRRPPAGPGQPSFPTRSVASSSRRSHRPASPSSRPRSADRTSRRRVQDYLALSRSLLPPASRAALFLRRLLSLRPTGNVDQAAHVNARCLIHYRFGLLTARYYLQPGSLVFGQLFGPPWGGSWLPLSPPTTSARSRSSSVRRVSLDSVSFFSFFMRASSPDMWDNRQHARCGRQSY